MSETSDRPRVLLVDDVIAGGSSKVKFARALAAAGAVVKDIFVVFDYGTFPAGDPSGTRVHSLSSWHDVVAVAREDGPFDARAMREIETFLEDPPAWSHAHGGIATPHGAG